MDPARFPPAYPHGPLREVLPAIFVVSGTVRMSRPPLCFSRNMTVVRERDRLVLVNSIRLSEAGLRALEALGRVTDVIRLAGFHGMDDPFYKHRYGAKIWAIKGQRYTSGFAVDAPKTYFSPDAELAAEAQPPIEGSHLYVFGTTPPEALLVIDRDGGVVIAGDCLQNWGAADEYFNWLGRLMMPAMGFIKPHNIGPGWVKMAKPTAGELRGILALRFEHVLPAHGEPVLGGAKAKYQPAIERLAAKLDERV